jgi:osmotically-inducible protein OsmY
MANERRRYQDREREDWQRQDRRDEGYRSGRSDYEGEYGQSGRGRDYGREESQYGRGEEMREGGYRGEGEYGRRGQGWEDQERGYGGQSSGGQSWRGESGYGRSGGGQGYGGRGYGGQQGYGGQWAQGGDWMRGDYDRSERAGARGETGYGSMGEGFGRSMEGQHRGRGPRGYTRSDERIREDVCDRLTDDPSVDASEIDITVSNSEVTLNGTVGSREQRRRAEDCAEQVSGVTHIQNNVRVRKEEQGGGQGTSSQETTGSQTGTNMGKTGSSGRRSSTGL